MALKYFNCSNDTIHIELNALSNLPGELDGSTADFHYIPYNSEVPRDAAVNYPPDKWGKLNNLTISFDQLAQRKIYKGTADRGSITEDLLLWIYPDYLVFSQNNSKIGSRVFPT